MQSMDQELEDAIASLMPLSPQMPESPCSSSSSSSEDSEEDDSEPTVEKELPEPTAKVEVPRPEVRHAKTEAARTRSDDRPDQRRAKPDPSRSEVPRAKEQPSRSHRAKQEVHHATSSDTATRPEARPNRTSDRPDHASRRDRSSDRRTKPMVPADRRRSRDPPEAPKAEEPNSSDGRCKRTDFKHPTPKKPRILPYVRDPCIRRPFHGRTPNPAPKPIQGERVAAPREGDQDAARTEDRPSKPEVRRDRSCCTKPIVSATADRRRSRDPPEASSPTEKKEEPNSSTDRTDDHKRRPEDKKPRFLRDPCIRRPFRGRTPSPAPRRTKPIQGERVAAPREGDQDAARTEDPARTEDAPRADDLARAEDATSMPPPPKPFRPNQYPAKSYKPYQQAYRNNMPYSNLFNLNLQLEEENRQMRKKLAEKSEIISALLESRQKDLLAEKLKRELEMARNFVR